MKHTMLHRITYTVKQKTQDLSECLAGNSEFASTLSLLSTGQSPVLVPHAPRGAARGSRKHWVRTERCEASVSRAALAQCARGTKLSVSTHQHCRGITAWLNLSLFLHGEQKDLFLPQNQRPLTFQLPSSNSGRE